MSAISSAPVGTLPKARSAMFGHVAIFAVGATSCVQIANVTMTALSVICLLLVPGWLLLTHRGVDLLPLVVAATAWIAFLASCLVNDASPLWPNAIAPAAFGLYLMGLTVLTGRSLDAIATVLGGLAAGTVIFFMTQGIELTHTGSFPDLWKYGIASAATILMLFGLAITRLPRWVHPAALAVLGLASLGLNYRSHALVCILAAGVLSINLLFGTRIRRGWQFAGLIAVGLVFSYVMPIAARAGIFGSALQRKTVDQDGFNVPLLLAGRTEPPMTISAILERPLLGWGSAMHLTPDVYTQAEHLAIRMGFSPTFPFELLWRLPATDYSATHSILLGAWAEGGVLAVLLPVSLLLVCLGLVWNFPRLGRWAPLGATIALQGVWDLMYGPWQYNMIPTFACIVLFFSATHFRGSRHDPTIR
ncbi:hypothetical protein [Mycolicibacterium hodleri]|nr:hypothetical protein [Mycolicibacterium hodleri]